MGVTDIIIDSRNRDTNVYNDPNLYVVNLPVVYKDVYSLEIHRVYIPQSQYDIDNHNNKIYYQYSNTPVQVKSVQPIYNANIKQLLHYLNSLFDPIYLSFTIDEHKISIHNNFDTTLLLFFSKNDSIGNVLGISHDIEILPGDTYKSKHQVVFQKEPYVLMDINGYSNMDNTENKSISYKHLFHKQHEARQIIEFTPPIGKLFNLQVSFCNFNNTLYNFNGYNHTFNVRIKHS